MCGIAGIVEFDARDADARLRAVTRMRESLAHRGPDAWGEVALHGAVAACRSPEGTSVVARPGPSRASAWLGHQRLSIIDLSDAGAQPMRSSRGTSWIVFNGEIYNFREIQASARVADGRNSDTAVLVDLLERDGMRALPALRGMFAFAFWNDTERALYLVRDRFGVKPLYWARPGAGVLAFGSEPRALRAAGFAGPYRRDADAAFLRSGHVPPATSAFDGLHVVPPGCWLRFDGAGVVTERWFDTQSVAGRGTQRVDEAASVLQRALDDSVRAHLVSDVPVGVFLSGGLDSAMIVASAARVGAGRLRTFTVAVPGSPLDESAPAARIARTFGTAHTEVSVPPHELAGWIGDALESMGEPTVDGINTFIVSRAASHAGVKVALSGLGADEVLGGYPSFRDVPLLWRALAPFRAGLPGRSVAAALARYVPVAAPGKLAEIVAAPARTRAGLWRQVRSLFERRAVRAISGREAPPDDEGRDDPAVQILDVIMRCEIEEYMGAQLLRDSDVFSMCGSLELRVPFVDHELMGRVHEHGWWPRGRHRTHKAAIVAAMADALPAGHVSRRKTGFVVPTGDWLRAALDGDAAFAFLRGPLDRLALRPYVAAFRQGSLDAARLWALVVRESFLMRADR